MTESTVTVSMRADNGLGCSYATVRKAGHAVLILLREAECAVFDLDKPESRYLLFKHYPNAHVALSDFYKLIGKMCAKPENSKYFGSRIAEDNRMLVTCSGEHMLTDAEAPQYAARLAEFLLFADHIRCTVS